jgi:two-component system capsular synthesis sensor histidine kinase RcsC
MTANAGRRGYLLTDETQRLAGKAMVIFCVVISVFRRSGAGEWLHSVTTPHELLPLLGRIFHVALASAENGRR